MRLSQRRAEAVLDHLISKGISPERLEANGFGPPSPSPRTRRRAAGPEPPDRVPDRRAGVTRSVVASALDQRARRVADT